jgi:hypothetical protein
LKYSRPNPVIIEIIQDINYDFKHFGMIDFLQHVSRYRRKDIIVGVMDCDESLFGVWFLQETADYICINKTLHPTHKIHVILHEIAHILLDHPRVPIGHVLSPELRQAFGLDYVEGHAKYAPQKHVLKLPHEQEAEAFGFLIQERVMAANRWHELTVNDSSIEALLPIINTTVS